MNDAVLSLRAKQRQQTRQEIVRHAFDLFAQHGYESVSVETITSAAGVSRATFFNYFAQKELLLNEIAAVRMARLREILDSATSARVNPSFNDITQLSTAGYEHLIQVMLQLSEENIRVAQHAKGLLLQVVSRLFAQNAVLHAQQQFVDAVAAVIERIPDRKGADARIIAESVFAVYLATTLEWLMRTDAAPQWLTRTMQERLHFILEGQR